MKDNKYKFLIVFNILLILLLIFSFILILLQNIININFYLDKGKDIIAERFIYEQFSHEIYSNIKSKIIYDIKKTDSDCESGYSLINFPIKIYNFYESQNIDNKVNSNKINEYNKKFYYIGKHKFCGKKLEKTYEELLSEYNTIGAFHYSDYILYDYFGHSFDKNKYNIDSPTIFVKNIVSFNRPYYLEMDNSIRVSILLNKKDYDESKVFEELKKFNEISESDIRDAFNAYFPKYSYTYDAYRTSPYYYFHLNEIIAGNGIIFEEFKDNEYLNNREIYWYYRTYIGFENIDELKKFKKYFDENDNKNNDLYKLANSLVTFSISIVSIIIIFLLVIFSIISIIYVFKKVKKSKLNIIGIPYHQISLRAFIISITAFVIFLIIYLGCFIFYYDKIEINMEYMAILNKYNERRKQYYLLYSIVIFLCNSILSFFLYHLGKYFKLSSLSINFTPNNIILVNFRLGKINCKHKIKLDKSKTFSDYFKNFEKILGKCRRCKNDFIEIGRITLDGNQIDTNRMIGSFSINEESVLIIDEEN